MSSVTKRRDKKEGFFKEIFPSEAPQRDLLCISCAEKGSHRAAGTAKEPSAVNEGRFRWMRFLLCSHLFN